MLTTITCVALVVLAYYIFSIGLLVHVTRRISSLPKSKSYDLKMILRNGYITYHESDIYFSRFAVIRHIYFQTIKTKFSPRSRNASIDWEIACR